MRLNALSTACAALVLSLGAAGYAHADTSYSLSSSDASANAASEGCNTAVAKAITVMQAADVDAAEQLAHKMIPFSAIKTEAQTCLPDLNNLGLGLLFSIPSLSQIENSLKQAVCNVVSSYESKLESDVQPLYNTVSSALSGNGNLGDIGGVSLGSIPVGVQVTSGSGFSTNIGEAFKSSVSDANTVFKKYGLF